VPFRRHRGNACPCDDHLVNVVLAELQARDDAEHGFRLAELGGHGILGERPLDPKRQATCHPGMVQIFLKGAGQPGVVYV
jgi:hypothetical protein